jgi:DNA invertase Pin-like site-specific DNA recombinase
MGSRWIGLLTRIVNVLSEAIAGSLNLSSNAVPIRFSAMKTLLASVAEFERELICERVPAGTKSAQHKGEQLGRTRVVFRPEPSGRGVSRQRDVSRQSQAGSQRHFS